MSVTQLCDATASGAETAAYAVMTPRGPLTLCAHHYREHAFTLGMLGYPAASLADITVPAHTLVHGTPGGPRVRLASERDHWGL